MTRTSFGIRAKLFIGFFAVGIIIFLSVLVSLIIISETEKNANEVITAELPVYHTFVDLSNNVLIVFNAVELWLITGDITYKNDFLKKMDEIGTNESDLDTYIKNSINNKLNQDWRDIKSTIEKVREVGLKIINISDATTARNIMQSEFIPLRNKLISDFDVSDVKSAKDLSFLDSQYTHLNNGSQKILNDMSFLSTFEYAILIISIFTSIIITLITANKILIPLKSAINIAKSISSGQRKIKIEIKSNDETGDLLKSLDVMQKSIKESEENLQKNEEKTRKLFENIVRSAKQFSAHSSKVASGDLREHLELSNNTEDVMNQLGNDLNVMTENLSRITKEITQACQYMVTMVEEVHHAVDSQSTGASEQASSINEISASLSEIGKSSEQTMEKAKSLGKSAERTREKGQQGLEAVDQSVNGMKKVRDKVQIIAQTILDLSNQTQQIGEITSVVNNLAQQSKMLALNASIEAAKAGEAGKGFSVVAVEVKNLAEQSEQATTQVQKILESIRYAAEKAVMVTEEGTKGVDEGTELVEQTGDIIRNLNDVIHETTMASQQIESAVRQESSGIEQITTGMNEINQVTASFIESVKQTTEAITNLSEIATNLKSYVDTYKV